MTASGRRGQKTRTGIETSKPCRTAGCRPVAEGRKPELGLKLVPDPIPQTPLEVAEGRKPELGLKPQTPSTRQSGAQVAEGRKPELGLKHVIDGLRRFAGVESQRAENPNWD